MGVVKTIVTAPFKITWAVAKGVGKVAFTVVDSVLTGYYDTGSACREQYNEYNSVSNEELVDAVKNGSMVERGAAMQQLKNRQK